MPFEPGHSYGGNNGGAGRTPDRFKKHREKAYKLLYRKALPLALGFLLECLRSQRKDDKRWATQLVSKKTLPDAAILLGAPGSEGATTLAGLIQAAAQAKNENEEEVNNPSDVGKVDKVIIPSLVKRPKASQAAKDRWKRKKEAEKNS